MPPEMLHVRIFSHQADMTYVQYLNERTERLAGLYFTWARHDRLAWVTCAPGGVQAGEPWCWVGLDGYVRVSVVLSLAVRLLWLGGTTLRV
jgi:hypothetical protein